MSHKEENEVGTKSTQSRTSILMHLMSSNRGEKELAGSNLGDESVVLIKNVCQTSSHSSSYISTHPVKKEYKGGLKTSI